MITTGGYEPLSRIIKSQDFKYTFNESRKIWTTSLYPFADLFISLVKEINWNSYTYNGENDVCDEEKNNYKKIMCSTLPTHPASYYFLGGCVPEFLNKIYTNVNLHSYTDPTGDIDVKLIPPPLFSSDIESVLFFFDRDNNINPFYNNYLEWVFNKLQEKMDIYSEQLQNMIINMVDFDINEYISENNIRDHINYIKKGLLYIISFLDGEMFRIQIICKIQEGPIYALDHIIELIMPLPMLEKYNILTYEDYHYKYNNKKEISQININNQTFNIEPIEKLIKTNIRLVSERLDPFIKTFILQPFQEIPQRILNTQHKYFNHASRLLYFYELCVK